jgi:hypothetical protein
LGDLFLGERAGELPLAAGGTYTGTLDVTLPVQTAGPRFLIVVSDAFNQIEEVGQEADNTRASAQLMVTQAPLPDLVVEGLQFSAPALQSGAMTTISWITRNQGPGAAGSSFQERVRVRNADTGEMLLDTLVFLDASGANAIGSTMGRAREVQFRLPDGTRGAGNLEVSVVTDSAGQLFEGGTGSTAETNNTASLTSAAALANYADLQIEGLEVGPASPRSGDLLTVTWQTRNAGDAAAGPFAELLAIVNQSTNEVLLTRSIAFPGGTPLAAGGTIQREETFRLPDGLRGVGNLLVRVTTTARTPCTSARRVRCAKTTTSPPGR